jgi:hypothetical protein
MQSIRKPAPSTATKSTQSPSTGPYRSDSTAVPSRLNVRSVSNAMWSAFVASKKKRILTEIILLQPTLFGDFLHRWEFPFDTLFILQMFFRLGYNRGPVLTFKCFRNWKLFRISYPLADPLCYFLPVAINKMAASGSTKRYANLNFASRIFRHVARASEAKPFWLRKINARYAVIARWNNAAAKRAFKFLPYPPAPAIPVSLLINLDQLEEKLLVLSFDYLALFIGLVAQKVNKEDVRCHVLI